ncbi:MAG: folate-binding protein YgfZ [Verrucomicrobiales bacterium]|nr:folate-binding protein YgfZ [Verrucomicrobiales bacterium]
MSTAARIDLSNRAKWRLSGGDRVRYLNGQVTNDVRRATASQAVYAMVTDIKGRICGDLVIHADPDGQSLLLDAEPDLRENLGARLERYIIADDAVLEDITEDWQICHAIDTDALEGGIASTRYGQPGWDLWRPTGAALPENISALPLLSDAEVEALRIQRGIPRYPNELNLEAFPPEAGLETHAMDFAKGCYIGQEVLSRIRTTGKMPRELVQWRASDLNTEICGGDHLFLAGENAPTKAIGVVTSVTGSPGEGGCTGLAYVKLGAAEVDSVLLVGPDMPKIDSLIQITAHCRK